MIGIIIYILIIVVITSILFLRRERFMSFKSVRNSTCGCKNQMTSSGTVYVQDKQQNTGLGWIL